MHVTHLKQTEIRKRIDRQNQVQVYLKILEASCMLFKYDASSKANENPNDLIRFKSNLAKSSF